MDAAPTTSPVPASAPPQPDVLHAWPASAQWVTAFLLGIVTTLLIVQSFSYLRWGTRPTELQRYTIDVNQASHAELRQLPGLGEAKAQGILDYRRQHGPFRSVDELRKVPGIGPATLERLRPLVYVDALEDSDAPSTADAVPVRLSTSPVTSRPTRTPGKKEEQLTERIDVNRASLEELQRLPGVGPAISQRIVAERAKRPFQSVDELRRVSGIGPKTLEKLRPFANRAICGSP